MCFSKSKVGFPGKRFVIDLAALLFWSCALTLSAAPLKVALIGENEPVALLTAELSGHGEVTLLERVEAEKILKEHNLMAAYGMELCRHFPHADVIGVVSPGAVSFFNAKNAFRLGRLPVDPLPAAEEIVRLLQKSADADSILLSVGFVTLTDIPDRVRPAVGRIVLEIEQTLMNTDNIQLLERGNLSAILRERELSETAHALPPSLQIIRCDFAQGSRAEEIDLTLRLMDTSGKTVLEKSYRALENGLIPARDVAAFLKSSPVELPEYDRNREAEQYLQEYYAAFRREGGRSANPPPREFARLRPYVDAMYVLAPENPRYRYEKLYYELCFAGNPWLNPRKRIEIIESFLDGARQLRREHPEFRFPGSDDGARGFCAHPVIPVNPVITLFQSNVQPTESEAQTLSRLCDEIRAMHMEIFLQFSRYALRDPAAIRNRDDLIRYQETIRTSLRFLPHFDAEKAATMAWQADRNELEAIADFMVGHPGESNCAVMPQLCFPLFVEIHGLHHKREAWEKVRTILNNELDQLDALGLRLRNARLNRRLSELHALKEFLNSRGTPEDLERCFTDLAEKACSRPQPYPAAGHLLEAAATEYFRLDFRQVRRLMSTIPNAVAGEQRRLTDRERGLLAISNMDRNVPVKYIQCLAFPGICENAVGNVLQSFGSRLYLDFAANREWLEELNGAFEIRAVPLPAQESPQKRIEYGHAAVLHNGRLYLLYEDHSGRLRFFVLEPEAARIRELSAPDADAAAFLPKTGGKGHPALPAFAVFGESIFIGGRRTILIYSLSDGTWRKFSDLPGGTITGIHLQEDTIYYLCGGNTTGIYAAPLSMHRCNLSDGNGRKTYFDGRTGTSLFGIPGTGFSGGFFPVSGGRVLFTMTAGNAGQVIAFTPAAERFELLHTHEGAEKVFSLRQNGNMLLGNDGPFFGCSFFRLDPARPEAEPELIFTQNDEDRRKFRYRISGYWSIIHPAVLAEERYLACAGSYGNWFLDLAAPEQSPLLLLPGCISVFYQPEEKRFLYPEFHNSSREREPVIFLVKLREAE